MNKKRLTFVTVLLLASVACVLSGLRLNAASPANQSSEGNSTWLSPLAPNPNWVIKGHGTCCEGNLAAQGNSTFVLLPVLLTGNQIWRSDNNGVDWTKKYPPVAASAPYGIEGDLQAFGDDVIYFGTLLAQGVAAHSDNRGESWTVVPIDVPFPANDQCWAYLGPFGDLRPGGRLSTDEPYVLAGWYRIGSVALFSFDGGLTWPIQTPLVGDDGSGSEHIVCQQNAHAPTSPGDTRIANQDFKNQKAGRYGAWGTDRKFYWAEPSLAGVTGGDQDLYVCKTGDFGLNWTGVKHPISPGAGQDFIVAHTAFDNKGTLYVLHGDQLYVSFNQGESFAFTHTLPRYGSVRLSDPGSDQFFVVNCGTIHIALAEAAATGGTNMWYLRGSRVDTASPVWDEELVENVGTNRLDFIQIVLNGNNIPTMSYTKPGAAVTTASRITPMPPNGPNTCAIAALGAVSRKTHTGAGTFDVNLPLTGSPGIECRTGGANGDFQMVVSFPLPVTITGATVTAGTGSVTGASASGNIVTVNLTGVSNAQRLTVTLNNVTDANGAGNVPVSMAVLLGDTTEDSNVNSADIGQTKSRSGTAVGSSNFRSDVTIDGNLNSADISLVKSKSGTALP